MKAKYINRQKVIAIFVALCLMLSSITILTQNVYATAQNIDIKHITENGITYTVETREDSITITQSNNETKTEVKVDGSTIQNIRYVDTGREKNGETVFQKDIQSIDIHENASDRITGIEAYTAAKAAKATKWNAVKKEKYKKLYWYRTGHNSSTKRDYLRIGCKAKYQLRTDNMSSARTSQCNRYKNAIIGVNEKYRIVEKNLEGTGIGATAVIGLIIANILYPPSVVVSILLATVTGISTAVATTLISATSALKAKYEIVEDQYATIKVWGKKY